jgi:hypothetical protein
MKVLFKTGPRAGETTHVERNAQNQVLIDCGFLELVPDAPPAPPIPLWNCGTGLSGRAHVRCTIGPRVEIYDGPPQHLVAAFKKIGLVVPADIAAKYAARFAPQTSVPPDEVEMFRAIRHGANDNVKR